MSTREYLLRELIATLEASNKELAIEVEALKCKIEELEYDITQLKANR